jgi:hypothetical protein
MGEQDPTAIDPNEVLEDQTPPLEYEPQPDLQSANAGLEEREPDLVSEADEELLNVDDDLSDGDADGEDDDAVDDDVEDPDQDDN